MFSSIKLITSSAVATDGGGFFVSIFIFCPFLNSRLLFPRLSFFEICDVYCYVLRCLQRKERKKVTTIEGADNNI
jgi:hypothetical protein